MRTGNWGAVDGENALLGLGAPQSETAASLFPHGYPRHFCRQQESWLTTLLLLVLSVRLLQWPLLGSTHSRSDHVLLPTCSLLFYFCLPHS